MRWKNPFIKENNYHKTVFFLLALTLVSLAFSVRILNSLSLILLVMVAIVHPQRLSFFKKAFSNPYFIFCLLLYFVKVAGLFYTSHPVENWKIISSKGILLAIPFFFCSYGFLPANILRRLIIYFSLSLLIVSLVSLIYAAINFGQQHDPSVFFYHKLVKPLKHHAVLFSFYLFFCIVYWIENGMASLNMEKFKTLWLSVVIYFYFFIFLLSSKLVIIISLLYLVYVIVRALVTAKARHVFIISSLLIVTSISVVVLTNNPIRTRFSDAVSGNLYLFRQDKFSPDIYFNGIQFRLLIWRFTYEILDERSAWLIGVSAGDAQYELNRKYAEANVYLGDGENDKQGYRVFNCHNVFLQTILESGIIGLVVLLSLIIIILMRALKKRDSLTIIFYLAILAFCFTESVLSSQYTILLFMFFPLLSLNTKTSVSKAIRGSF